jgi:hypothetical protein
MKQTRKMLNWLVGAGVVLAMVTSLTAQTVQERTGQVVRLKGAAQYSTDLKNWHPVKVGTKIKSGDIIQTAADSYADIVLGEIGRTPPRAIIEGTSAYQPQVEQDVVRVMEDSVLAFDKLTVMKTGADEVLKTHLDLRAGKIFGWVKKMSAESRYEIKLPNGVAGVRGTTYSISAVGIVEVYSGSVSISRTGPDGTPMLNPDGTPMRMEVNAGYQFDLRTWLLSPLPPNKTSPSRPASGTMGAVEFTADQTTYYVSPK